MEDEELVVIPDTKRGRLCKSRLQDITTRILHRARDAATAAIQEYEPGAELTEETPLENNYYTGVFALPSGGQAVVTYEYTRKTTEIEWR